MKELFNKSFIYDYLTSKRLHLKRSLFSYKVNLNIDQKKIYNKLKTNGIVKIKNYLSTSQINKLNNEYKNILKEGGKEEEVYNLFSNILKSKNQLNFLIKKYYVDIIETYLSNKTFIDTIVYQKFYPSILNKSSYMWHHDNRSHQIKIQILLNDNIEKNCQRMQYLLRTHNIIHSRKKNRFNNISKFNNELIDCYGSAGDAFIFDTNGVHRGFRNDKKSNIRELITLTFLGKEKLWRSSKI